MKRKLIRASILLALTALFAWIAVPNILVARNRSRQKRTMADIRTIATAWEARATDINSYTIGAVRGGPLPTAELVAALRPTYVREFPRADGCDQEFQFLAGEYDEKGQAQVYSIRSLGSDRRPDRDPNSFRGATTDFTDDVVYSNGSFLQYPEGAG